MSLAPSSLKSEPLRALFLTSLNLRPLSNYQCTRTSNLSPVSLCYIPLCVVILFYIYDMLGTYNRNIEQNQNTKRNALQSNPANTQEPTTVLATGIVSKAGEFVNQLLIQQWKGKPVEDATWEEEFNIESQFPKFSLEDKFVSLERGSLRTMVGNGPQGPVSPTIGQTHYLECLHEED